MTDRDRAVAFRRETYRRRAELVETYPWGELVLTPSLPRVYDANLAIVDRWDEDGFELLREMDRVQQEHGFGHRKIVLPDEELATRLWPELDWPISERSLLMARTRPPDRPADASIKVVSIADDAWGRAKQAMSLAQGYDSDAEVSRQLLELAHRLAKAIDVRHFAAQVDGAVASYASLYLDDGLAQIEDVATLPAHQGKGLSRAVVLHATAEATRSGANLVFIVADDSDWPKELYGRLGFDRIDVEHIVVRPAGDDEA